MHVKRWRERKKKKVRPDFVRPSRATTHLDSLPSVSPPILSTPRAFPPTLSTYVPVVSSRGREGSSTDPMINFPPFSLVPISEPSLRLFAKQVLVRRLELPKRFDNNYCEACSSD